jgi:hypothetical protein
VWLPKKVPSDITSLNHKNMLANSKIKAKGSQYPAYEKLCIVETPDVVKLNKLIQVKIGQGEGETK